MNEKELTFNFAKISNTCEKCKYGVIVNPNYTNCVKYPKGKPDEIYFGGKECPMFVLAKKFMNK